MTLVACAYFVWAFVSLYRFTKVFVDMFKSMGVELPLSTQLVVANYGWFYPIIFGGGGILLIVKQFYVHEKWPSLAITSVVAMLVVFISGLITQALYAPLYAFIEKVK